MSDRLLQRDMLGVCMAIAIADGDLSTAEKDGMAGVVAELGGAPIGPADVAALMNDVYTDIGMAGDTKTYLAVVGKRHDEAKRELLVRAAARAMHLDGKIDPREEERLRDLAAIYEVDLAKITGGAR